MYFRIFDCWRLAAALLIMTYHFLYQAPDGQAGIEFLYRLLPLLDMFFMISGFLIMQRYGASLHSPGDYLRFLRRRFARLYPLHLITLAFFTAVALAVAFGAVESAEPRRWALADLPLQLLAVHAWGTTDYLSFNYPSWSVSAEFFCYLLFPLIAVVTARTGLAGLVVLLILWIGGLEYAAALGAFPEGHWTTADTLGAYRAFADFTIGAAVALLVQRRVIEVGSHLPGIAALGLAVCGMLLGWSIYLILAAFAAAMLFTALAETARPDSTLSLAFIMPVSRVAFGIYLWHPVMETIFLSLLWKRLLEPSGLSFYLFWLVPMLATVVVAMLSERLVEKRFADALAGSRRKRPPAEGTAKPRHQAPLVPAE